MKQTLYIFILLALIFTACTKEESISPLLEQEQASSIDESGISFVIEQAELDLKNNLLGPQCHEEYRLNYALITINDIEYNAAIKIINGAYVTETIELESGIYQITNFLVYYNNRTANNTEDDIICKAAPQVGSEYADFISNTINTDFTIEDFQNIQMNIDVLCYDVLFYNEFGFGMQNEQSVTIEHQSISGAIRIEEPSLYEGSLYEEQNNGIQTEVPAIYEIHVYKNGIQKPLRIFSNEANKGEGSPMDIFWPNNMEEEESFNFELWVLLPTINGFEYVLIETWTFNNEKGIPSNNEESVNFKIGNFLSGDIDYIFDYSMLGTGDVQITLRWDNEADLDLWVTDPSSETLFYNHTSSLSGGILDIDDTDGYGPENIFWPINEAPAGDYLVQTHHFSGNSPSTYAIDIVFFGNSYTYTGMIYPNELLDIANLSVSKSNSATQLYKRQRLDPLPIK